MSDTILIPKSEYVELRTRIVTLANERDLYFNKWQSLLEKYMEEEEWEELAGSECTESVHIDPKEDTAVVPTPLEDEPQAPVL